MMKKTTISRVCKLEFGDAAVDNEFEVNEYLISKEDKCLKIHLWKCLINGYIGEINDKDNSFFELSNITACMRFKEFLKI